ncbi:MAG TPA: prepilin-type N-terminal cleavage/methylation domain-containing protein [Longimicrobiales bacterium]|nr:prepilin-type N-terminal cleavage/methylation domain-containing protein [Longimicrobiales bacterium]
MRSEGGFTLAELLVVAVLGAVILGAVFQTLSVQNRTFQRQSAVISAQESSRTALAVLSGELREVSSTGQDLLAASADSVSLRVLRKIGFVCDAGVGGVLSMWVLGQPFEAGDSIFVFSQGPDLIDTADDAWIPGEVSAVTSAAPVGCGVAWPKETLGGAADGNHDVATLTISSALALTDVTRGAPARTFERLTYGRYTVGGEVVLGRRSGTTAPVPLVGPLAAGTDGLRFEFFDADNNDLGGGGAVAAADLDDVSFFTISVQGRQAAGSMDADGFYEDSLAVSVFLRNNDQNALN